MGADKFKESIDEYGLVKKKDQILLGISGGPDSVYMLQQFLAIKKQYKLTLVAVHFNHGLRPEADKEEEFVKKMCGDLKLKCITEKRNVRSFFDGDSLEQTARNLRYDFFLKCSRQMKIKKLALAHHQDDLVETMLMRLVRGAGLRGLRGFLPQSRLKSLVVIRPLIQVRKKEIVAWLKKHDIPFCIDKSNFQEQFLRNKIRLQLMPFLRELNPNIVQTLWSLSKTLAIDYDYIYSQARCVFDSLKKKRGPDTLQLNLQKLKALHPAMRNNVLRIAIEEVKGNTRRIEARHLAEIESLILQRPKKSIVHLPFLTVTKEDEALLIRSAF